MKVETRMPLITKPQTRRWKSVSLASTVKVANACCKGADFMGCSKTSIYADFATGSMWSCNMDTPKFVHLMEELSHVHTLYAAKLQAAVNAVINYRPNNQPKLTTDEIK